MGKKPIVTVAFILTAIFLAGLYFLDNREEIRKNITNQTPLLKEESSISSGSSFVLESINNEIFHLTIKDDRFYIEELKDKLVFLKVFGWDCKYCKKEIPELIKLKRDLSETFEIIAIEGQNFSKEESLRFIKEYAINYPVILGYNCFDLYSHLQENYSWSGEIPLTIVIGKGGRLLAFELGAKSYTLAELMKTSLLKEKQQMHN